MKEQKRNKTFDKNIIECIQKNYSFYAWNSLNGVIEKCEMKGKAFRNDYGEIEFEAREGNLKQLQNVVSGDRKISIYIPEMAMSFQAPLKSILDDGKIKIVIPEEFSIHERRKHERVLLKEKCFVYFEIKPHVYKKAIYDISMGGIALIIPKTERWVDQKEISYTSIILELDGVKEKIHSKVTCTNIYSFDKFKYNELPYGGVKISFCFKEMSIENKKVLQEYIITTLLSKQVCKKAN
jgi:hypothetical protein